MKDEADKRRVRQLLDELLDSDATPEEVCASCPEFLPEVRARWEKICRLRGGLEALFPSSADQGAKPSATPPEGKLPQIPGYEVERELGRGGMGIVYRAWHQRLNRAVALKMLLAGPTARPEELKRFLREAQAVAGLRHPNIVQVHDVGEVDGRPYFTMELIEGGNLDQRIRGNPQPPGEAAALLATLAQATQAAHQSGIVHRDLKPSNILLSDEGRVTSDERSITPSPLDTRHLSLVTPKITDFGLARRLDGEGGLTLSGAPMGTPSYMAPEQAAGDSKAIGPTTDVYSLGAILYELLTGRPPFRADSAAATLQQVMADDPVPPARLNPRVPRDLDTICLKCLRKEPHRRYASAAALADDLRRFERGEPIAARPTGAVERGVRWVRRRPALAAAVAAGLLLAVGLTVTVLWWYGQRTALEAAAVAYAEADLSESERLRDKGEFKASAAVLQRAKDRLREFVPPELRDRLQAAFDTLELVTRLDAIRLERALVKPYVDLLGPLLLPATENSKDAQGSRQETPPGRHYEEAFRKAGIGAPGDDVAQAAARVRASPVRGALVAALDDWAACATDQKQQAWVLEVVREADPNPWRNRVRNPATWDDSKALGELAERAPVAEQSPQLLVVLGARLRAKKLDAVPFLARVVAAYPADFWANIEMGNALVHQSNTVEAIAFYRTALMLRPQTVSVHYALGGMYLSMKRWDQAIAEFEQAVRLDPDNPWCHNRLGFTLAWSGREDKALVHFREAVRLDPNLGWSRYFLAIALENKGLLNEAADEFRQTARLLPEKRAEASQRRRALLLKLGRSADARAAWKEELAALPASHDDWFGYAELCLFLGDEAEYRRARRDLLAQFGSTTDPVVAERTGRACLLLPAAEGELSRAVAILEGVEAASRAGRHFDHRYVLFAIGLARYRQDRFADAIKLMTGEAAAVMGPCPRLVLAMAQYRTDQKDQARKTLAAAVDSYDWSADKAISHDAWIAHILRREAEASIAPKQK
jgi:serine/threonine-protein kinase